MVNDKMLITHAGKTPFIARKEKKYMIVNNCIKENGIFQMIKTTACIYLVLFSTQVINFSQFRSNSFPSNLLRIINVFIQKLKPKTRAPKPCSQKLAENNCG